MVIARKTGTLLYNIQDKKERKCVDKKKPCDYLLSHLISSIIGTRELDFRVRDGNGYNLSVMVTWHNKQIRRKRIIRRNNNMVKPHDLLVLVG